MQKEFQPHIQGLRAVAVLAVVFFHAFPASLPGGFIGVDIFFVISGYLISGIIYRGLAARTFSFVDFYVRRIKRIFPALMLVMGSCLMFGYIALLPEELGQLGMHTTGGAGFFSNFLLWREANYFDNSAASKPLLHLWSLGVEEQFYIVWPVLVFLAWKWRRGFVALTIALALASFAYNLVQVQGNPTAAFYSPLSRFWEIAVGSLLAYRHFCRGQVEDGAGRLSLAGAVALFVGFYFVSSAMPYPGLLALIPVVGTALLLAAGPDAPINRSLLSLPSMQWIGSISYPLYLWHWPLFSFAHILQSGQSSLATRLLALATSVALAHITWLYVEKRFSATTSPKRAAALLACMMAVTAGAGYAIKLHDGYPQRQIANLGKYLPQESAEAVVPAAVATAAETAYPAIHMAPDTEATFAALKKLHAQQKADVQFVGKIWAEKNRLQRYSTCHLYDSPQAPMSFDGYLAASAGCVNLANGKKNILVFGDSAAAEIHLALARAYPDINFVQVTGSACKPFHAAYQDADHRCLKLLDYALGLVERSNFDGVVVASQWRDDFAMALPDLQRFQRKGKPLMLVSPPLMFSEEVAKTIMRMGSDESLSTTIGRMEDATNFALAASMQKFAKQYGLAYLDRMQLYCEGGCPLITGKGEPMILDHFHLSMPGIDEMSQRIKANKTLETMLPPPAA